MNLILENVRDDQE